MFSVETKKANFVNWLLMSETGNLKVQKGCNNNKKIQQKIQSN